MEMIELGKAVKFARENRQMTQYQVGVEMGIKPTSARSYICHLEKGRLNISVERLRRLAHVLSCPARQLIPEGW